MLSIVAARYNEGLCVKLEAARLSGGERVEVDAQRYVDIKLMRQVRNDDRRRSRRVIRQTIETETMVRP